MKTCFRLWSPGWGLLATGLLLQAQAVAAEPTPAKPTTKGRVRMETLRLIREDAAPLLVATSPVFVRAGSPGNAAETPAHSIAPTDNPEETVVLEPLIVTEKRTPAIPPAVHETPVAEFLRTGTIWEKIGRKFTKQFFCRPDKGIGFSFSW